MKKYLLALFFSVSVFSVFAQSANRDRHDNFILTNTNEPSAIVLRGTVITQDSVIRHGYVAIANGRIVAVSDKQPDLPNAINVNTHGIILPGFIDVHNHVVYNVLPRWSPGRLFTNRNQWRSDPEYTRTVSDPIKKLRAAHHFCDMNAWGELRALVGGTTSIMATDSQPCIHGLVRNLDFNSGFYGTTELNREHILNVIDLPPANPPSGRAFFVGAARSFIANPFYQALFVHLSEGTDSAAESEFTFIRSRSLLNPKGRIIHGISLTSGDFQAMAHNGTALVWSPRSNLELYGQTADIASALDASVEIALAPDWAVTGSANILNELKVAALWNRERLGGRLSDHQLVDMVTSVPAHIAGIDDEVGIIRPGLRADILVLNGDHNQPYHAVIDATPADVEMVLINGVPLYGDRTFMEKFWKRSELEEINLSDATKTLAMPAASLDVTEVESRLRAVLDSVGASLAPLTESSTFQLTALEEARIWRSPSLSSATEQHGKEKVRLTATASPNPSRNYFTVETQSNSSVVLKLRVVDAVGRVVETREQIANTTFRIGNNLKPGIYLVEISQGPEWKILKLIRR